MYFSYEYYKDKVFNDKFINLPYNNGDCTINTNFEPMKCNISLKLLGLVVPILLLFMVVGCMSEESTTLQKPENLIDSETMKKVMLDIQLAESYTQQMKRDTSISKAPIEEYYQQIFALHETNFEDFKTSFEYYTHLPDSLQKMYEDMLNTVTKMESTYNIDKKKNR